jgi:hemerythrin
MEWTPTLSVKVSSIDHEHRALLGMINELQEGLQRHNSREVLQGILSRLTAYTMNHFGHEEKIMRELQYPGYARHKSEHDAFVARISEFRQGYSQGEVALSAQIIEYLQDWLRDHIEQTDKQYSDAFNAHGYC